jgi:hypothetical protein
VAALYLIGAAVYGVALGVATFRTTAVEQNVTELGASYTNAVQLKARYEVLKDRQELKFAALECWNLTAKYLPDTATLDTLNFIDGRRMTLQGKAPSDQTKDMLEFEGALRKAANTNGEAFFDASKGDHLQYTIQGGDVRWNFSLELKRVEVE